MRTAWMIAVLIASFMSAGMADAGAPDSQDDVRYRSTIRSIAEAIEHLKPQYPQLADFSARQHCNPDELTIDYEYSTHAATQPGGWRSAVPSPNGDGIWLHIDFHDPDSQRMIHTQPVVQRYRYLDKSTQLLLLEGEQTKKIGAEILRIFREHGVVPDDGQAWQ